MITEEQKQAWLDKGYDPITFLHRQLLIEKINKYAPFQTLLDVGCGHGPDLALLEVLYPHAVMLGVDLIAQDVTYATQKLRRAKIVEGDIRDVLPSLLDKSFDIVFSNGVIMYNDAHLIKHMLRVAKKAVILSERSPLNQYAHYLRQEMDIEPIVTKIEEPIRHSWRDDGFIYEIPLEDTVESKQSN